jgi:hypothetical protein
MPAMNTNHTNVSQITTQIKPERLAYKQINVGKIRRNCHIPWKGRYSFASLKGRVAEAAIQAR